VSNSAPQKAFIDARARERGLSNLKIETADMNFFQASGGYDRILSVEMFEHMRNYEELLEKTASWMKPDGLLFLHIFVHKDYAYPFSAENSGSWMARTFFTGGIMPSEDLLLYFQKDVRLAERWRVDGRHYQKTCEAWLRKMDEAREPVMKVFRETYGKDAAKWRAYWRIFFMACAELFGYRGGGEWFVAHYLFERQSSAVASAEPSKFSESR
ncbi:MAG TPA: class I SAM-dependent methyltransferase, partial [Verrucomicrobiae bacterium]|nr:class I SAM-dependent methyltransferase [Verrucomicrobiae bacterium]